MIRHLLKTVSLGAAIALPSLATFVLPAAEVERAPASPGPAAGAPSKAIQGLQQVIAKINAKITQGKRAEADYVEELKEYDALITAQEKIKNDDTAQILWMRGVLHYQVFDDPARANEYFRRVQKELPDTQMGRQAANTIAQVERLAMVKTIQKSLTIGAKFPDFSEVDIQGKPLSVSRYKGKVVLVDFWATWCGPCVMELPNVIATYQKFQGKGFDILGISLDKDLAAMKNFTETKGMPWAQYFDGKLWENKLAQKYGIGSIPATFLLDGQGTIIAKDLRGPDLERAVADALAKK